MITDDEDIDSKMVRIYMADGSVFDLPAAVIAWHHAEAAAARSDRNPARAYIEESMPYFSDDEALEEYLVSEMEFRDIEDWLVCVEGGELGSLARQSLQDLVKRTEVRSACMEDAHEFDSDPNCYD